MIAVRVLASLRRFRLRAAVAATIADFLRVRASGGASERGRPSLAPTSWRLSARLAMCKGWLEFLWPFFCFLPMERRHERAVDFGMVVDERVK